MLNYDKSNIFKGNIIFSSLYFCHCTYPVIFITLQGFAIPKEAQQKVAEFTFHGTPAYLRHGDVVIAAITSCTNTSNPSVMLGAALVAKKACELGLEVRCLFFACQFSAMLFEFYLPGST